MTNQERSLFAMFSFDSFQMPPEVNLEVAKAQIPSRIICDEDVFVARKKKTMAQRFECNRKLCDGSWKDNQLVNMRRFSFLCHPL